MTRLRVFLADDHPVVRSGLRGLIDAQPDMAVVGEATEGESTVREATRLRPDVLVMDVSMPGVSGVQATVRLRQECPEVRVIALTAHEDRGYRRQMVEAGAIGYILKRAAAEDLIRALREVAAGRTYFTPPACGGAWGASAHATADELSTREEETVRLLALGFTNKQIASQLELSVKTVETYKSRALEKLGLHSRVDLVRYASQKGWLPTG